MDHYKVCSIDFMRALISGNRTKILSKDIKHITVPCFDTLSIAKMLEWAKKYPEVANALPEDPNEIEHFHRNFIANVIYTLVGENFRLWVDKKMRERTKRMAEDRDMNIKMDPEIYKIFKASSSISGKCPFALYSLIYYPQ